MEVLIAALIALELEAGGWSRIREDHRLFYRCYKMKYQADTSSDIYNIEYPHVLLWMVCYSLYIHDLD